MRSDTNSSRIETHCITRTECTFGKPVQEREGRVIDGENVESPSTGRVTFHTVKETTAAVFHQFLAKSVAISVCCPVGCTPCLHHSPPICVALLPPRRRNTDGAEIGQKVGGKGGEVGHRAGI